jgi:DNA (cytosine-5)-methyltransferase 1
MPAPKPADGPQRTVREAWQGLPAEPDGKNHHYAPKPTLLALERIRLIQPGGDKRDVLLLRPDLAPPSWRRSRTEITDVWGRMEWDRPSNTLRTALLNVSKGRYIHPEQHRVISLREAARLQSIPDEWQFATEPYPIARQIGNSVPPLLGLAVARAVREALA